MQKNRFTVFLFAIFLLTIILINCSFPVKRVFDPTVPVEMQSVLKIGRNITVTAFNGVKVDWPHTSELMIPAGSHTIIVYWRTSGGNTTYYVRNGEVKFDFAVGRIYELNAYMTDNFVNFVFENIDVNEYAVLDDETVVTFRKVGTGDYPTYVHIMGMNYVDSFYLPRLTPKSFVIPNGKYTLTGSKSIGGNTGEPFEFEAASSGRMMIEVIGPNIATQPSFRFPQ